MSGRLGLSSPWARQAIPADERAAIEARIRDGYTVGVGVLPSHSGYRTWVVDSSGPKPLMLIDAHEWTPMRDIHDAIDRAVDWIDEYDGAIWRGVEVPVR